MEVQPSGNSSNIPRKESASSVTFHLVPGSQGRHGEPLRKVAKIETAEDAWQHGATPEGQFEKLVVELPEGLPAGIVAFARRHIGPDATEPQIKFFCHTFAQEVGSTATESMVPDPEGTKAGGTSQALGIITNGTRIAAAELAAGEHVVVGESEETRPRHRGAAAHSAVGIGGGLAIQVDGPRGGDLYVGYPQDYVEWLKEQDEAMGATSDPGLYVHRESTPPPGAEPSNT